MSVLTVIFPYFNEFPTDCSNVMNHFDNKDVNVDHEKLHEFQNILSSSRKQFEDSLLFPNLLRVMEFNKPKKIKIAKEPDCSDFLLCTLALLLIQKPASLNQICILLGLLFPAFLLDLDELKDALTEVLTEAKEFVSTETNGVSYFKINSIELRNSTKMLRDFVKCSHNFNELRDTFFDTKPDSLNVLLKSVGIQV